MAAVAGMVGGVVGAGDSATAGMVSRLQAGTSGRTRASQMRRVRATAKLHGVGGIVCARRPHVNSAVSGDAKRSAPSGRAGDLNAAPRGASVTRPAIASRLTADAVDQRHRQLRPLDPLPAVLPVPDPGHRVLAL